MKINFLKRFLTCGFYGNDYNFFSEVLKSNKFRNEIYKEMDNFYYLKLNRKFIKHREFFEKNQRGFGENAFHSMWYLLFSEFKPVNCLEIGVYRGQVLTLWKMLSEHFKYQSSITGISPFTSEGDGVSVYSNEIDYLSDVKLNHRTFNLEDATYCVSYSNSEIAIKCMQQKKWDLIYIDGGHDYEVVLSDMEHSIENLSPNGIIVMDDSSLYFDYQPSRGSFAGHPGPSRVAKEFTEKINLIGGIGHNNIFMLA